MRAAQIVIRGMAWVIIALLILPPGIPAQETEQQPEQTETVKFTKEELTQMLASLALYPDSMVSQILMASTYPLEIVEAERWLRQNKGLKGDELDNALKEKTWDPSVKSLCHYPDVLFAMSEKLDQTRKLGDAFLSQEDDVMTTIQELRRKAEEQGNLKTTKEQKVIDEDDVITIEPSDPQVVYVPQYDPLCVYGPWWYPAYPPYYWYYPPGIGCGYVSFGLPVFIGFGWFSWSWFDWRHHHIHTDFHKAGRFHRFGSRSRDFDRPFWRHDPGHRKGVAYRDSSTSFRFGSGRTGRTGRTWFSPETRGFPGGGVEAPGVPPSRRTIEQRKGTVPQAGTGPGTIPSGTGRWNLFRGIGNGNFERKASERGGISRQSPGMSRQSPGMSRQSPGMSRQSPGMSRQSPGTVRQGGGTGSPGTGSRGGFPGRGGGSGGPGGGGSPGKGGGFRK